MPIFDFDVDSVALPEFSTRRKSRLKEMMGEAPPPPATFDQNLAKMRENMEKSRTGTDFAEQDAAGEGVSPVVGVSGYPAEIFE